MANTVTVKKSSVPGKIPQPADLQYGELALNYADGELYFKNASNTIRAIGATSFTKITTNTTAIAGASYLADTSGGTFTLTLPASPTTGDTLTIADGADFGTNALTVARNGSTIEGITDDLSLNIGGISVTFTYNGTSWQVYAQIGVNGGSEVTLAGSQNLTNKTLTSPTINAGALTGTFSGDHTLSGQVTLSYTGAGSTSTLNILGYNSKGGTGYHDFLKVTNGYGSATNANKWFRLNSNGALEVVNSGYSATILQLDDSGNMVLAGNLTMSARPAFRVTGAGTTSISATNTLTSSNFAVDYNQGGYLNTSTGVFTAPIAGLYQVGLVARFSGSASISAIQVQKTSGGITSTQLYLEWAGNSTAYHMGGSTIVKMAANDTLKLTVTAGTVTFDANDQWSVAYIG
jgi:hypothetical protein